MITQNVHYTPERYDELTGMMARGVVVNDPYCAATGSPDEAFLEPHQIINVAMYGTSEIQITYAVYDDRYDIRGK